MHPLRGETLESKKKKKRERRKLRENEKRGNSEERYKGELITEWRKVN
jgi:hypothetical protein